MASNSTNLLFALSWLTAFSAACSDGNGHDAAPADDADGGVIEDADVGVGAEDAGVPAEAGVCGCSYGFHQECAPDEICSQAYVEPSASVCTRAEPRGGSLAGGCSTTSTSAAAPCTAQCVTSTPAASPCDGMDRDGLTGTILGWRGAINNPTYVMGSANEWEGMLAEDIENARRSAVTSRECIDFLGWTVLSTIELCRGAGSVQHGEPWDAIENRRFKVLRMPDDICGIAAGNLCVGALELGVGSGTVAANLANDIPAQCPNGLPYAAPCNGADAQECVEARLATIIRALHVR